MLSGNPHVAGSCTRLLVSRDICASLHIAEHAGTAICENSMTELFRVS